jgi:phenylacetate-CoA ligase
MTEAWAEVLRGAGVTAQDRAMIAFSFGPFIGLWLGFEAAQRLGALVIPGGAMNSEGRIEAILQNDVSLLCCTPTYALRLGEVAHELGIDLAESKVRKIVVGGEPGASVPATRAMIEAAWPGAELFDHYGLTEVGPVTFQCGQNQDLVHVLEEFQLCEIIDPESGEVLPANSDEVGELVITNLGRGGSPVFRYRTRDLVKRWQGDACACGRPGLSFAGGIIGRADDMRGGSGQGRAGSLRAPGEGLP